MNRRALYQVVGQDERHVWIVDLDGPLSVTNDAERVCVEVNRLFPGRRIIYQDTMGKWDELVHQGGRFTGFAPARDNHPPTRAGA